jgi:hypothetical protein
MLDEADLRHDFPMIPWDQPVEVHVSTISSFWCCRICIALEGVSAQNLIRGNVPFAFPTRKACLDHIEEGHHE